jgi:hypothetical protein
MTNFEDNESPYLSLLEGSTPATPGTGLWRVFVTSGGLCIVDDAGTVVGPFGAAGGGGLAAPAWVAPTGDFTVANSVTWTDITGVSVALVTGAHRVKISWSAYCYLGNAAGAEVACDATIDGTRVGGGTHGLGVAFAPINTDGHWVGFEVISPVLTAASHTFKVQARGAVAAGGVIYGSAGTGVTQSLIVEETSLTT